MKEFSEHLEHETIKDDNFMQLYFSIVRPPSGLVTTHWHNHVELLYVLAGNMEACINDTCYPLASGDLLIVNPKDLHHTTGHNHPCTYCLLQIPTLHLECISSDWKLIRFQEYISSSQLKTDSLSEIPALFAELIQLDAEKGSGYRLLFLSKVYRLLYLLYSNFSSSVSVKNRNKTESDLLRIEESIQFVKKNYRRQFTLTEVANALCLTPEYFCRLFKKMTGQTFFTYVSQIRLLHFYHDLLQTEDSITFLLEKNGIHNYKVFMREFKKTYGDTPFKIRMQHRNRHAHTTVPALR